MFKRIDKYEFVECFKRMGRGDQFSRQGLFELFDWLEEINVSPDNDYIGTELDVIGLCCEFAESTLEEIRKDYFEGDTEMDDDDIIKHLEENTTVIWHDGENVLYQQF